MIRSVADVLPVLADVRAALPALRGDRGVLADALAMLAAAARATMPPADLERALARDGAAWFAALDELAKRDPGAAGALARAMWGHLSAHRPESPAPLSTLGSATPGSVRP